MIEKLVSIITQALKDNNIKFDNNLESTWVDDGNDTYCINIMKCEK